MLNKSEKITVIAPIIHNHHRSKFEVYLIVYFCRKYATFQIMTKVYTCIYNAISYRKWVFVVYTNPNKQVPPFFMTIDNITVRGFYTLLVFVNYSQTLITQIARDLEITSSFERCFEFSNAIKSRSTSLQLESNFAHKVLDGIWA